MDESLVSDAAVSQVQVVIARRKIERTKSLPTAGHLPTRSLTYAEAAKKASRYSLGAVPLSPSPETMRLVNIERERQARGRAFHIPLTNSPTWQTWSPSYGRRTTTNVTSLHHGNEYSSDISGDGHSMRMEVGDDREAAITLPEPHNKPPRSERAFILSSGLGQRKPRTGVYKPQHIRVPKKRPVNVASLYFGNEFSSDISGDGHSMKMTDSVFADDRGVDDLNGDLWQVIEPPGIVRAAYDSFCDFVAELTRGITYEQVDQPPDCTCLDGLMTEAHALLANLSTKSEDAKPLPLIHTVDEEIELKKIFSSSSSSSEELQILAPVEIADKEVELQPIESTWETIELVFPWPPCCELDQSFYNPFHDFILDPCYSWGKPNGKIKKPSSSSSSSSSSSFETADSGSCSTVIIASSSSSSSEEEKPKGKEKDKPLKSPISIVTEDMDDEVYRDVDSHIIADLEPVKSVAASCAEWDMEAFIVPKGTSVDGIKRVPTGKNRLVRPFLFYFDLRPLAQYLREFGQEVEDEKGKSVGCHDGVALAKVLSIGNKRFYPELHARLTTTKMMAKDTFSKLKDQKLKFEEISQLCGAVEFIKPEFITAYTKQLRATLRYLVDQYQVNRPAEWVIPPFDLHELCVFKLTLGQEPAGIYDNPKPEIRTRVEAVINGLYCTALKKVTAPTPPPAAIPLSKQSLRDMEPKAALDEISKREAIEQYELREKLKTFEPNADPVGATWKECMQRAADIFVHSMTRPDKKGKARKFKVIAEDKIICQLPFEVWEDIIPADFENRCLSPGNPHENIEDVELIYHKLYTAKFGDMRPIRDRFDPLHDKTVDVYQPLIRIKLLDRDPTTRQQYCRYLCSDLTNIERKIDSLQFERSSVSLSDLCSSGEAWETLVKSWTAPVLSTQEASRNHYFSRLRMRRLDPQSLRFKKKVIPFRTGPLIYDVQIVSTFVHQELRSRKIRLTPKMSKEEMVKRAVRVYAEDTYANSFNELMDSDVDVLGDTVNMTVGQVTKDMSTPIPNF